MSPELEHLLRELTPQVLGIIVRRYRDFTASEDAVQEALLAASQQWPREGVPENPRAWLIQVASRKFTDQVRAEVARRRREAIVEPIDDRLGEDDTLVLMSMCCHPSLSTSSAIALTLRAVGGLTTAAIAHAFLVPEATMAQRISRAKQTIRDSGVPFEVTQNHAAILHVLYLIFNEGYTASAGESLQRNDLATEAIRLTRSVLALLPNPEVTGLLALMLLTDARRAARTGALGEPIPLDQQDRSLWNPAQISEGVALTSAALKRGEPGPYQLQAAIAAVHDEAATFEATDWPQILMLYDVLLSIANNPMVALNHAVATAMVYGPAKGLALLDELNLKSHHRWHAARAHLLEMDGDLPAALVSYQTAAAQTASQPERTYLLTRAARLRER